MTNRIRYRGSMSIFYADLEDRSPNDTIIINWCLLKPCKIAVNPLKSSHFSGYMI